MSKTIDDYFDLDENKSDYEKREIYDFEVYKPVSIEQSIKNKDLTNIRDDLMIYSCNVEDVLHEDNWMTSRPAGLEQMLRFLKLAVESNNLHVLRSVWIYGIETYFKHKHQWWSEILIFIADLIYQNDNLKMLKFLISKIEIDNKKISIKVNNYQNKWSGARRKYVFANLLGAAVYYNNIGAIELLLPKQPEYKIKRLQDYMECDIKNIFYHTTLSPSNQLFFYYDFYSRNILCSDNPTSYAFDNGNIEALDTLIKNGYKIDFKALDFSYQISNFGHSNTIKYLFKNYPNEFKNLDVKTILRAANHLILKRMLDNGCILESDYFTQLFIYNDAFHEFNNDIYESIKEKNIEKCAKEFVKLKIKVSNIQIGILHSFYINSKVFLDLCLSLYDCNEPMDITHILSDFKLNLDVLRYLSEKTKLICNADKVKNLTHIGVRDFLRLLKLVEFQLKKSDSINEITKHILSLNAVTGVKLLCNYNFITSQNYSDAVDYIVNNRLEKLLPMLIANSKNIGGIKRNYDI